MFIQEREWAERDFEWGIGDWKGREDEGPCLNGPLGLLADLRASVG